MAVLREVKSTEEEAKVAPFLDPRQQEWGGRVEDQEVCEGGGRGTSRWLAISDERT